MFTPHHTAISVADMEVSTAFYKQFGFTDFFFWQDEKVKISHLKLGDFILEIFCYQNHTKLQPLSNDLRHIGTKHFAMQVGDINEAKTFCLNHGISIAKDIKKGRTKIDYFFIRDPDGILVEIVQDNR